MRPNLVYVGTYTRSGASEGIYVYERDPESGRLALLHTVAERDPSFLAFAPDRRYLYSVSETRAFAGEGNGEAVSFAIEQGSGDLTPLSRRTTHGGEPCHLATDATGRFLFVANHEHGSVATFPIGEDGVLAPSSDLRQHEGSGPGPSQQGPHAHFVTLDPSRERVLVADKGIDKVMLYTLDAAHGALVPHDPPSASLHPGAAPRHIAFHPNGRYMYVNGEADMTITAFAYDGASGQLTELHYLSTLPDGATGERFSTAQILVEPRGRFVYVSNRGHNSIAIFAIDAATGRLTAVGHQSTLGETPRNFAIDSSGTFLYAANQNSDSIVQFRLDPESGGLEDTGNRTEVGSPVCILLA